MKLTDEEKRMLNGDEGEVVQQCMKVLVTLGDIYGAEKMLPVNSVHSPGVSYRVTGDAGLGYVEDVSKKGGHFKVPTTLNTIGIDSKDWEKIGFPRDFSLKQLELLDAYAKLGAIPTHTCTPYLIGNVPQIGQHVAWGESSAIAFVNSVLGARTNREGGPTALAAAITGRVPAYGFHLDENRKGNYLIKVEMNLKTERDFGVLGYFTGQIAGKNVPVFEGIKERPTIECLKALSAALASSGAVALYHIVGITPEAPTVEAIMDKKYETIKFGPKEYDEVIEKKFNFSSDVDFVVFGCPHCSIVEIGRLAKLLYGKKVKSDVWICTSRQVKLLSDKMGYTDIIEKAGALIVCDTCPVLCPTSSKGYKTVVTNSAKMAHYIRGLWNVKSALIQMEDCIDTAIQGKWGGR
jgi:predicted aconitase